MEFGMQGYEMESTFEIKEIKMKKEGETSFVINLRHLEDLSLCNLVTSRTETV